MAGKDYESLRANYKCMLAIVLVSLSPFQYGIDFGLIGGIQAMIVRDSNISYRESMAEHIKHFQPFMAIFGYKDPKSPVGYNISPTFQQLIGSLMTLGAFVASGFSGPLAQILGRKSCLWIACVMCCVSDAIMMGTTSVGGLYFARLLIGLSNGRLCIQAVARFLLTRAKGCSCHSPNSTSKKFRQLDGEGCLCLPSNSGLQLEP